MTAQQIEAADPTVHRCLAVEPWPGGRTVYLIETEFETFPRFVVGCVRPDKKVEHLLKCGALWSALKYWAQLFGPQAEVDR